MEGLFELIYNLFFDYTLRTVALGGIIIGITAGALGSFLVLRRQSLLGDSISHSVLPGVILAFMVFNQKESFILVVGALIMGWLSTLFVMWVTKNSRIKNDSALGISLSVFFSLGIVLLVMLDRIGYSSTAGLDDYIFGKAAAIRMNDIYIITIFGGIAIIMLILFWKEFKLLAFNREFGDANGLPMNLLDIVLTTVMVISIVIGLQMMGVVLMSAMLIGPAVSARQWVNSLGAMVILASVFGAVSGVFGAAISYMGSNLPTGPFITIVITVIVIISILFSPKRGLLFKLSTRINNRNRFKQNTMLTHLYHHRDTVDNYYYPMSFFEITEKGIEQRVMNKLIGKGFLSKEKDGFILTDKGIKKAKDVLERMYDKD
jgi:manganese/zinc/iron transport system permease protein